MKFVLTPAEMQQADRIASEQYGILPIVLMENAALNSAQKIREIIGSNFPEEKISSKKISVNIFCGSGNNGGDGFAIARHLYEDFHVRIFWIGAEDKMSDETRKNFLVTQKLGIDTTHFESEENFSSPGKENIFSANVTIDALIGNSGSEELRGIVVPLLNNLKENYSLKIAIDVPTGLNALNGKSHEFAFKADRTITMFAPKVGMYLNDGLELCGNIQVVAIGAPEKILFGLSKTKILEEEDIEQIFPNRKKNTSKFDYGRIAVIAGSDNYSGAACLCANAAIKSGAGLVELFTTKIHPSLLPEVIVHEVGTTEAGTISKNSFEKIFSSIEKFDVIATGPGLGDNEETLNACRNFLSRIPENIPVVIDADALRVFDENFLPKKNFVLTPHTGEFARMIGRDWREIEEEKFFLAEKFAEEKNCTLLLKGMPTIISNGKEKFLNLTGNPGMATAGSGDVLTGIIAALLGRKIPPTESAALAAYLHSQAGDLYADYYSQESVTASAIIETLGDVFPA